MSLRFPRKGLLCWRFVSNSDSCMSEKFEQQKMYSCVLVRGVAGTSFSHFCVGISARTLSGSLEKIAFTPF